MKMYYSYFSDSAIAASLSGAIVSNLSAKGITYGLEVYGWDSRVQTHGNPLMVKTYYLPTSIGSRL